MMNIFKHMKFLNQHTKQTTNQVWDATLRNVQKNFLALFVCVGVKWCYDNGVKRFVHKNQTTTHTHGNPK